MKNPLIYLCRYVVFLICPSKYCSSPVLSCTFPFRPISLPTHHFSTNLLMACPSQTVTLSLISRLSLFVQQLPQHVPHPFLDIISIYHAMVSSLWWTFHLYEALFTLAPSLVSSPLLPLLFFPSALCLSPCVSSTS